MRKHSNPYYKRGGDNYKRRGQEEGRGQGHYQGQGQDQREGQRESNEDYNYNNDSSNYSSKQSKGNKYDNQDYYDQGYSEAHEVEYEDNQPPQGHYKNFKRRNDEFGKNKHQNQYDRKREYHRKNPQYGQNVQEVEVTEPIHSNIDPNYDRDAIRIKGKLLDIEIRQEDEANKVELDEQREQIKTTINATYDKQMSELSSVTKKGIFSGENILVCLVSKNDKLRANPELLSNLLEIFQSSKSDDEIQQDFADLLGYEEIETVGNFIQNRKEINELISVAKTAVESSNKLTEKQENLLQYGNLPNQIEIVKKKGSEKKKQSKELQQIQKDNLQMLHHLGFDRAFLKEDPIEIPNTNPSKTFAGQFDNVSFQQQQQQKDQGAYETTINRFTAYCEVTVKPILKERKKVDLVYVKSSIPEWCQSCFNFVHFNEIQSEVFRKAFSTDENLLISAPTGAGKTNIALMTILHEITKELKQKNINPSKGYNFNKVKWELKMLYLAPLKALVNEIVNKFNHSLGFLNIVINEFSGDVNLSKEQIDRTNLFIGIPEKWDLFTRKNDAIFNNLKLMVIDEIHLLNEDRGRVLECIVARTIRKCELNQKFIRLAGLSATLPNYWEVGDFLRVKEGMFSFDASYRATPLTMKFLGIKDSTPYDEYKQQENDLTYNEVMKYLKENKQVLVFVHSRIETINFAKEIIRQAQKYDETYLLNSSQHNLRGNKEYQKISNKTLSELIPFGVGFHNAGVLRKDKNAIENLFATKCVNVLVSTSTLAWGVNLPAYAVIIKGTNFYDASQGTNVDIGILDIQQMFGRAGRPQYDTEGVGIIMAPMRKVQYFVSLLKNQIDIESSLDRFLPDSLNAEIAIGNIASIEDAMSWIKLTYLSIRLTGTNRNKNLDVIRGKIKNAFDVLNAHKLIRFIQKTGQVHSTELGRIASNYYMSYKTIALFYENLTEDMGDEDFLSLFSKSDEFSNLKLYPEEKNELSMLAQKYNMLSKNSIQTKTIEEIPKPIILIQTYLQGGYEFKASSLYMDCAYIIDNSPRILRAMVEISLHKHFVKTTFLCLNYMKHIERRIFPGRTPMWQFTYESSYSKKKNDRVERRKDFLPRDICCKLDMNGFNEIEAILQENKKSLCSILSYGMEFINDLLKYARIIPRFIMKVDAKPLTRTILNFTINLKPKFNWSKRWNHLSEPFWVLVDNQNEIIHYEFFMLTPKQNEEGEGRMKDISLTFAVPFDVEPGQKQGRLNGVYSVHIVSDRWLGCQYSQFIPLNEIEVPENEDVNTDLLDLYPLSISALQNEQFAHVFSGEFQYFNPVQTQVFFSCYNSDENILVGAPTGSGKTVVAELAILRLFKNSPTDKIIYIAPLKSLAKERLKDWTKKFFFLKKNVIELTGDYTPDLQKLLEADVLITTPEKWDGISRNWHHRAYVRKVGLVIIDEIHLLGLDRGPIIEVIVSRMRFISFKTEQKVRFIGLSTALANSYDVAEWLGINTKYDNKKAPGLFNFKPAVRPCPVTVHIEGFPEKHYCPRMATMNKPCYNSIVNFSDNKPVLIFVSSRRQTRLTALDLISLNANTALGDYARNSFLRISQEEIEDYMANTTDENLRHTLSFGIGMHHAGLVEIDRKIVEELFATQKIQILIATSTLAWGVNFPAHLVIIKGTEYYHPKQCTYVDMPITDILQMIGRAGRPQYDDEAIACLFVKQEKKNFYKKFLYEPFPLESSLHMMLYDHINAEIASGMLTSKQLCIEYIKWTYFFKRLVKNPKYYGLQSSEAKELNAFLWNLIDHVLNALNSSNCIKIESDNSLSATLVGNLASFYYISYKTAFLYETEIKPELKISELITLLSQAEEYNELPVRHSEDTLNKQLAESIPIRNPKWLYGDPHVKANILIQAHMIRFPMLISDYKTDLKLVLDNCIRVLLFMADIASSKGFLDTTLNILSLIQLIMQGLWTDTCTLLALPYMTVDIAKKIIQKKSLSHLCELAELNNKTDTVKTIFKDCSINMKEKEIEEIQSILNKLPLIEVEFKCYFLDQKTLERKYNSPLIEKKEAQLFIKLKKTNDTKNNLIVHSRYPKVKSCRWFVVLGNVRTNQLIAFDKVSFKDQATKELKFIVPNEIDDDSLQLFIMSDSYSGIDQQYPLKLLSINKAIVEKYGLVCIDKAKEEPNEEQTEIDDEDESDANLKEQEGDIYLENW